MYVSEGVYVVHRHAKQKRTNSICHSIITYSSGYLIHFQYKFSKVSHILIVPHTELIHLSTQNGLACNNRNLPVGKFNFGLYLARS